MTILGGDYELVEVRSLDLVGYTRSKGFVILNPVKNRSRKLPNAEGSLLEHIPLCIRAKIANNQVVNFSGQVATLHDIDGVWHYKLDQELIELGSHTFFEIGAVK